MMKTMNQQKTSRNNIYSDTMSNQKGKFFAPIRNVHENQAISGRSIKSVETIHNASDR